MTNRNQKLGNPRTRWRTILSTGLALCIPALAVAAIELPHSFEKGKAIIANQVNQNFQALVDAVQQNQDDLVDVKSRIEDLEEDLKDANSMIASLNTLPGRVTSLEDQVDDLTDIVEALGSGNRSPKGFFVSEEGVTDDDKQFVVQIRSPGTLMLRPASTNWELVSVQTWIGDSMSGSPPSARCGSSNCTDGPRSYGSSVQLEVLAGEYVQVKAKHPEPDHPFLDPAGAPKLFIYWRPDLPAGATPVFHY